MKKFGSAVWTGGIRDGQGTISTETSALREAPYGFKSRFEDGPGTNPEELLGAAHRLLLNGAVADAWEEKLVPDRIETRADVTLVKDDNGFTISAVHLTVKATIPGTDEATFKAIAEKAKAGCPVSRVLNATITMDASLVG